MRAAIITRGLAEMRRFTALGGQSETVYGLSGAGDLALSCSGPHSRNMAYGLALGQGRAPDLVLAEGRHTVAALPHARDLSVSNCPSLTLSTKSLTTSTICRKL